jgi:hypothetical protein
VPRAFWFILAALVASWLGMNLWSAPRIEEMAGGLRLLDMRFTGYAYEDARAFIAAIGDPGRALYLGPQLWMDMVYPRFWARSCSCPIGGCFPAGPA